MENIKKELLELFGDKKPLCALLEFDNIEYKLKTNYTDEDYDKFMGSLNLSYDNGYGCQELFGTVWFLNGDWADRGEYDGSEWWQIRRQPTIPKKLIN